MEPVTVGELLLQRIADRLDAIDVKLGQGPTPEPTPAAQKPSAKKSTSKGAKQRVDVDGR